VTRDPVTTLICSTVSSLAVLDPRVAHTIGQLSLESSTSFRWGKGRNVTSAGWQVTLCDPMWHVSSRSGVATLRTAIHLLLTYLLTYHGRTFSIYLCRLSF